MLESISLMINCVLAIVSVFTLMIEIRKLRNQKKKKKKRKRKTVIVILFRITIQPYGIKKAHPVWQRDRHKPLRFK